MHAVRFSFATKKESSAVHRNSDRMKSFKFFFKCFYLLEGRISFNQTKLLKRKFWTLFLFNFFMGGFVPIFHSFGDPRVLESWMWVSVWSVLEPLASCGLAGTEARWLSISAGMFAEKWEPLNGWSRCSIFSLFRTMWAFDESACRLSGMINGKQQQQTALPRIQQRRFSPSLN